jgi:heavy metal sensor kinase
MPSKRFDTVKFRLTLFSGAVIAFTILASFLALYEYLARALQANVDQVLSTEINEFASIYQNGGMDALRQEVELEEVAHGKDGILIRIFDDGGRELFASDRAGWGVVGDPPAIQSADTGPLIESAMMPDGERNARRIFDRVAPGVWALIAVPNDHTVEVLAIYRARCIEVFVVSLVACLAGAWVISRRAMRGVEILTTAAKQIDDTSLSWSVPAPGYGREIDELAAVLNEMLSRIASLVNESKTLNDNIAHEFRSPMTRIRGTAEMLLDDPSSSEHASEMAASIIEECDALLSMVNSMLAISEMESGIATMRSDHVELSGLVRETCELFETAAEDRGIELDLQLDGECEVQGDRARLRRAFANILDNAVKYTPANGHVSVSVASNGNGKDVVVMVEDDGTGIPEKDLERVFDRFYRCDERRSLPGNGLGLGLVRAIVQAHGGSVTLSPAPKRGTVCRVSLPRSANGVASSGKMTNR